jgi:hypothetical protein
MSLLPRQPNFIIGQMMRWGFPISDRIYRDDARRVLRELSGETPDAELNERPKVGEIAEIPTHSDRRSSPSIDPNSIQNLPISPHSTSAALEMACALFTRKLMASRLGCRILHESWLSYCTPMDPFPIGMSAPLSAIARMSALLLPRTIDDITDASTRQSSSAPKNLEIRADDTADRTTPLIQMRENLKSWTAECAAE